MESVLVFGSEDCMSWEETTDVIHRLREDEEFSVSIKVLDPVEHDERFRDYGLVICPSIVYRNEIVSVGPPDFDHVKSKILELHSNQP